MRRAVAPLGITELEVFDDPRDEVAATVETGGDASAQRDEWERRVLGTSTVQQQLDKLRAHEDKPARDLLALKRPTRAREVSDTDGIAVGEPRAKQRGRARAEKERAEGSTQQRSSDGADSRFLDSLMDDDEGGDEGSEEAADLVMGTARDGGKKGGGKKKNVISRSGNRMGQRQRKRILEQAQAKEGGVTWHSSNRTTGDKSRRHGNAWGGGSGSSAAHGTQQAVNATSTAPPSEKLHPSWAAKKASSAQGAIRAFEGNKTTF